MDRRQIIALLPGAALLAAASSPSNAQTRRANALGIDRFDSVSVNIIDFDAAITGYRNILGLEVDVSWKVGALNGKQLTYLSLNGTRILEIVAANADGTGLRPAATFGQHFGRTGYGHLCVATENVDIHGDARRARCTALSRPRPIRSTERRSSVASRS